MTQDPHSTGEPAPLAPAAPGWYADANEPTLRRWWNGAAWTEHTAPAEAPAYPTVPAARARRVPVWGVVAIVAGALIVLGGIAVAVAIGAGRFADATIARGDGDARPLEVTIPADWEQVPVMGSAGSIAHSARWEDVSDWIGATQIEESAIEKIGVPISVDGAWLVSGDLQNGAVILVATSAADVGGPSSARLEAHAFLDSAGLGVEGIEITSEGEVLTSAGFTGYVIEYEFPYYGETLTNAVGVITDGPRQLLVYTNGSETLGSGVEELEIVLDSLTLDR